MTLSKITYYRKTNRNCYAFIFHNYLIESAIIKQVKNIERHK